MADPVLSNHLARSIRGQKMSDITSGPTSRKIRAFLYLCAAILVTAGVLSKIGTPSEIINYALSIQGAGGLFTIGGQAAVDAIVSMAKKKDSPQTNNISTGENK
jgi:hypothetical protein